MRTITEDVQEAIDYWNKKDVQVDILYHNTRMRDLDEMNFRYRSSNSAAKGYYGVGIFTHAGYDKYFDKFGRVLYAVVVKKGGGKTMEEEEGNRHMETFVARPQVLEIIEL